MMLSCDTYVTKERFNFVKRAETYLAVRIVRKRSRRVSRGETGVPVVGLGGSGIGLNKRISFESKVEFFFPLLPVLYMLSFICKNVSLVQAH